MRNSIAFQNKSSSSQRYLLSSCSARVILIASGLWLLQVTPLRAMESEESAQDMRHVSTRFYKDADHPLTQNFWIERDLSERLKGLKADIEKRKKEIISYKTNTINITDAEIKHYVDVLKCPQCTQHPVQNLKNIHLDNLFSCDNPQKPNSGWSSGTEVIILRENDKNLIVIKKFDEIKKGLEELFYSLIALDINPAPQRIKMARIYDAVICPENCLSIIMEAVNTDSVHSFISTSLSTHVVKAYAKYLAIFHTENHHKLNKNIDRNKYIRHVSQFSNSLLQNTLKEEHEKFKLLSLTPREKLSNSEKAQSNTVVSLLSKEEQKKFERFVKASCDLFEKNAGKIFGALNDPEKKEPYLPYFLTITHGDAHAHNFFYDGSQLIQNGFDIPADSFQRVSMIDFASIIKTYGGVGDPAEDVGRFLAALRNWGALQQEIDKNDEKVSTLQRKFIQKYLKIIRRKNIIEENNQEFFEKLFKENCSFYELRYYRAIFNVQKNESLIKDREIKKFFLESWIRENANLEDFTQESISLDVVREKSKERPWTSVATTDQKEIIHWLPARPEEFIESAAEESHKSYLTLLWEELHDEETSTLSSKAIITGMGGVGKTSLALEYAHEARDQEAYNLIYWLFSGTAPSLVKSYRDLLLEMGIPIEGENDKNIIELVKKHVPEKGKCLLIYDNVSDLTFLRDKIPSEKTHVLITSRYNELITPQPSEEKWEKPPLNLNVFRREDSAKYLFNTTGLEVNFENENIVNYLAEELAHHPLALSYAAHYIKFVGRADVLSSTFEKYLEDLRNEPTIHFEERRNFFKEAELEITYENLIGKTLRISGKYLSKLAKDLMTYCAYLDPDSIAEEIFIKLSENRKEKFEVALSQLSSLAFIKKIQDAPMFSIHRLLQLVARNEKELSKEGQQYHKVFSDITDIFKTVFEKTINTAEQVDKLCSYLPHILQLLEHSRRLEMSGEEINSLEGLGKVIYFVKLHTEINQRMSQNLSQDNLLEYQNKDENKKLEKILKTMALYFNNPKKNVDDRVPLPTWLLEAAEKSHPTVQKSLSALYALGKGVKRNDKEAFFWCTKAAEQGDAEAQRTLGYMYEDGPSAVQNDKSAVKWYTKAAKQKDVRAQGRLGYMYENGLGTDKNDEEAAKWYMKAAKKGHTRAQVNLGAMYEMGRRGVDQNEEKAIEWYARAAEQGDSEARSALARIYENSSRVIQNKKKTFELYTKAAEQGDPNAQVTLGHMYETGQDTDQSDDEAIRWYTLAKKQGHIKAGINLQLMHEVAQYVGQHGAKIAKKYIKETAMRQEDVNAQVILGYMYETGRGVVRSNKEAVKWYKKAAEKGNIIAQLNLGCMYENGLGVGQNDEEAGKWYERAANKGDGSAQFALGGMYRWVKKNNEEAAKWYIRAARSGHAEAQCNLGEMYENGWAVPQEPDKAIEWYERAAHQGYAVAQGRLGERYENGWGVVRNDNMAVFWYQKAADQGHPEVQLRLGARYETGWGVVKNDEVAILLYKKAADQGHPEAQCRLGTRYENGWGVPKDYDEAIKWYQKAAEQGFPPARFCLARAKQFLSMNIYMHNQ